MYIKYLLFFLIINLISSSKKEVFEDEILVINEDTFDTAIKKYENLLIAFYTPHCLACKKMLINFNNAAMTLKPEGKVLAKVNCAKNKRLRFQYKIDNYPTLLLFNKYSNKYIKYEGEYRDFAIIEFVRKNSVSEHMKNFYEKKIQDL